MRHSLSKALFAITALCLPLSVHAANGVRDNAGLFSSSAVLEANSTIAKTRQQFGEDLLIETFPAIPDDIKSRYTDQNRAQFFLDWATTRAKGNQVDGVYVLINKDPQYLQAVVGNDTLKREFTAADRNALAQLMRESFREGRWDEGLHKGTKFVHDTYAANMGKPGAAAPAPAGAQRPAGAAKSKSGFGLFSGSCFMWLIVAGIAFFVIRMIAGRRQHAQHGYGQGYQGYGQQGPPPPHGHPGYGPGGPGPAQGGGFGRGMLGGLLGGLAGGYLWDRMSGPSHGNTAYGSTPPDAPAEAPPDTDYTGGGGGDWGGGGDIGGGGDFGGGDAGGGGDF